KVPPNVFLTTDAYREAAGLKLGDQLSIKLCDESSVPAAKSIVLEPLDAVAAKETPNWEHAVWFPLKRAVHVFPGMTFDCTIATYKKRFRVQSVNAETDNIAACSDDPPTVSFRQPVTDAHVAPTKLIVPDIPGLAAESKKLAMSMPLLGSVHTIRVSMGVGSVSDLCWIGWGDGAGRGRCRCDLRHTLLLLEAILLADLGLKK
ncbi:hypothetical protein BN1723_017382, partial [Verticillium longisporum]